MSTIYDVIVVGGGISGLSAAYELKNEGIDNVVVLEARDRVGGRTYTLRERDMWVDLGGSYVGPTQNRVLRMAKHLALDTYLVNEVEDLVYIRHGRRYRFSATDMPSMGFLEHLDLNHLFRKIDELGEEIPDSPWEAPRAAEWDTMTWKEFVDRTCWTQKAREFGYLVVECIVTVMSHEISMLGTLWYIKQCHGIRRLLSTTNGGQERKFQGGSMQLSERLRDRLGADTVITNSAVVSIDRGSDELYSIGTIDGKQYKSKYIITAMSPYILSKIHFTPSLPPMKVQMMERNPVGSVMKVIMYYRKPYWRDNNYCGSSFLTEDDQHPAHMTFDDTKPDESHPALVGFVCADKLRRFHLLDKTERKRRVCESFAKIFESDEMLQPVDYKEFNWMGEQYSGGCYTGICPPGFLTSFGPVLRTPVGKIYFAGTETAIRWSGYMEGAIESGERAAREVLHSMGKMSQHRIWTTEPPSKDVPPFPFEKTFWDRHSPSVGCLYKTMCLTVTLGLVAASTSIIKKYGLFDAVKDHCQHAIFRK